MTILILGDSTRSAKGTSHTLFCPLPESQLSLYFVLVVFLLIADICSYTFLVDVSNRRHIISPVFHEIGQAYFWRYYYTHTHMVKADISLYQDRSFHLTQIPQYFPLVTLICHIHRFPSVLRDKHDLIGVIPLHMLYISIVHLIFILFLFVAATPLHFIIRIFYSSQNFRFTWIIISDERFLLRLLIPFE